MIKLSNDQALVYSKHTNSMPPTSMRVEFQPCVDPDTMSSSPGTVALPNEVQPAGSCEKEPSTGLILDARYSAAQFWEYSETSIMQENGVFD